MSLEAANPRINATVTASAGSGKTYMLVTRILRLLLEGAEPGGILALTFTRKAAAEMQQRLSERLYQLATVDDERLRALLGELELDASDPGCYHRARDLYEKHQYCDYPVRTLTFHSFCQDLLARFPLEADIPPSFDLLESSELLIRQARDALFNEATLDMQGELAQHLQQLLQEAGSLFSLDRVLDSFLQYRSDWWAYTDGQLDPVAFASQRLAEQLEVDAQLEPLEQFFNARLTEQLTRFAPLLAKTGGKKNLECADRLADWLVHTPADRESFEVIRGCFLTSKNTPIVQGRKESASLSKKLGDDASDFYDLQELVSQRLLTTLDQFNRQHCWQLNHHWFYCGEKFVQHYQQIKRQQRLLDFTDLEWRSYKLLQDSENALWVQYKLDQQVRHLLIDEFQDTNPTQWQLMLPLLEEMAAGESDTARSVFLVGDEKQSIYSFRRAKPELQQQASSWLQQHLDAKAFPLNKSWRSSPAIIEIVNRVFEQDEFRITLPGFSEHATHHETLPGSVEIFPVIRSDDLPEVEAPVYCRNSLQQPRQESIGLHQLEARQVADHILRLVKEQTPVMEGKHQRPLTFNDIFILVRRRSHVAEFEQALRQAGIPFLGTRRGSFLECLEINDMEALIDTLLTPFNNLSLAQVLKSPLFDASDDDLQLIASLEKPANWYERLTLLSESLDVTHPVRRAHELLGQWHTLTDKIPVHDLLDRIFDEGDVLERYQRSTPEALQGRVKANLTLFLEMALDLDSGRYPSLMHFLDHLRSLRNTQGDAPDEAPMETLEPRVRIMTIHASKGLEAPVVYLADTINPARDRSSLDALIDWPVEEKQPVHFQLIPSKDRQDEVTRKLNERHADIKEKENANLLYVAITRARQYLFISGSRPDRGPFLDWYQPLFNALKGITGNEDDPHLVYQFTGDHSAFSPLPYEEESNEKQYDIEPRLLEKISVQPAIDRLIAPSRIEIQSRQANSSSDDADAQTRGIAIHRMLELLCQHNHVDQQELLQQLSQELSIDNHDELTQWMEIALNNYQHPDLQIIFNNSRSLNAYNECPVHFSSNGQPAYGIIDRLVVEADRVILVDYKTHSHANQQNLSALALSYHPQMALYTEACRQIWPGKQIDAFLLFTECVSLFPLDTSMETN